MLPCLDNKTVKMLYGTADERYNFSSEFFRQTHYPQSMNQYYNNQLLQQWTEEDLFRELQDEYMPNSNRVYIIFGSTGSGKSELLCWLKDQWQLRKEQRPVIRLSRSELNPQLLVKKCYETLGVRLDNSAIDDSKWDILLKKPVSIVNQIIWTALSEIMDSDEQIVPTAFLLRPIIEKNIVEFSKQVKKNNIPSPLEIITELEFEEVKQLTTIPIEVKYKTLKDVLVKKFEHFLFHGHNLAYLIRQLSKYLQEHKIRPLLLIDDLVQSVNLYAAEILDHFITLEEGNWDVVVGLTPGVINSTDYDKEFNQRIQYLDTIDDRVKKLWLSDESGATFFSISKNKANEYIENYMKTLKRSNGFECSKVCPHYNNCAKLLIGEGDTQILPLNTALIHKIYDGIPSGKGILRYMILHTKEILTFLLNGQVKNSKRVQNFINRDCFIDHELPIIKLLGEMFADSKNRSVKLPGELLRNFKLDSLDIALPFINLVEQTSLLKIEDNEKKVSKIPGYFLDWIDGKEINENLLDPIRKSVNSIIHEIVKGTNMSELYTARYSKGSSTIQRGEIINRYKYPITFKGTNKEQICISKDIHHLHLLDFNEQKPRAKANTFSEIANSSQVAEWIYKTERLKKVWEADLESLLGIKLYEFAFGLNEYMKLWEGIYNADWTSQLKSPFGDEFLEITESMFLDWFSLRDNLIDFSKKELISNSDSFEAWLMLLSLPKELKSYKVDNYNLDDFLNYIKTQILEYQKKVISIMESEIEMYISMLSLIQSLSPEYAYKIKKLQYALEKGEVGIKQITLFDNIKKWFLCNIEEKGLLEKWKKTEKVYKNMEKFIEHVSIINDTNHFSYDDLDEIGPFIREKLKVRPRTEKHLVKLVTTGETKLPRNQWRGIVEELDKVHPDLLKKLINIELKINN